MSYTMIQTNYLTNHFKKIGIFLILLICFSCNKNAQLEKEIEAVPMDLKVERFDQVFMKSTKESLPTLKTQYPFLFPKQTPDSIFLERTQDPIQKLIQKSVDSVFSNFQDTEAELIAFYKHLKYYNPSLKKPRVITVFSDVDYRNKVIVTDSIVLISIDNYLGADHEFYESFYNYIRKNLKRDQIVMDLADAYAFRLINQPRRKTFLEELIYHGKKLYLKDLWVPLAEDSTKIAIPMMSSCGPMTMSFISGNILLKMNCCIAQIPNLLDVLLHQHHFHVSIWSSIVNLQVHWDNILVGKLYVHTWKIILLHYYKCFK